MVNNWQGMSTVNCCQIAVYYLVNYVKFDKIDKVDKVWDSE